MNKISPICEDFSYAMVQPLSTIMMVQDMFKSGRLDTRPEIKNKYMSIAKRATEHLFTLINKIVTISKLENYVSGNLAVSMIRKVGLPTYEIQNKDYGYRKFNKKVHIMEQNP